MTSDKKVLLMKSRLAHVFATMAGIMIIGVALAAPASADETMAPPTDSATTAPATETTAPPSTPVTEGTPTPSASARQECEAYVYTGTTENLCARFPGDQEGVSCTDVDYQVTLTNKDVDPWGLDGVAGMPGFGCESNPLKPVESDSPLPVTGSTPWTYVLVGMLILISGVTLYALVRRNRVTFRS